MDPIQSLRELCTFIEGTTSWWVTSQSLTTEDTGADPIFRTSQGTLYIRQNVGPGRKMAPDQEEAVLKVITSFLHENKPTLESRSRELLTELRIHLIGNGIHDLGASKEDFKLFNDFYLIEEIKREIPQGEVISGHTLESLQARAKLNKNDHLFRIAKAFRAGLFSDSEPLPLIELNSKQKALYDLYHESLPAPLQRVTGANAANVSSIPPVVEDDDGGVDAEADDTLNAADDAAFRVEDANTPRRKGEFDDDFIFDPNSRGGDDSPRQGTETDFSAYAPGFSIFDLMETDEEDGGAGSGAASTSRRTSPFSLRFAEEGTSTATTPELEERSEPPGQPSTEQMRLSSLCLVGVHPLSVEERSLCNHFLKRELLSVYQGGKQPSSEEWELLAQTTTLLLRSDPSLENQALAVDLFLAYYFSSGKETNLSPGFTALYRAVPTAAGLDVRLGCSQLKRITDLEGEGAPLGRLREVIEELYRVRSTEIRMRPQDDEIELDKKGADKKNEISKIEDFLVANQRPAARDFVMVNKILVYTMTKREIDPNSTLGRSFLSFAGRLGDYARLAEKEAAPEARTFIQLYQMYDTTGFAERFSKSIERGSRERELWMLEGRARGATTQGTWGDRLEILNDIKALVTGGVQVQPPQLQFPVEQKLRMESITRPWQIPFTAEEARSSLTEVHKNLQLQLDRLAGSPIDVRAFVDAFKKGRIPKGFLERFEDQGRALLGEVYSYCVYEARLEKNQTAQEKWVLRPASKESLEELSSDDPHVMHRVLTAMYRPAEQGGRLRGCPIQQTQVPQLARLQQCVRDQEPATWHSDTGSGKSTMANLANEIFDLGVKYMIHVAPFGSRGEEGWEELVDERGQITLPSTGTTCSHLWVDTTRLKAALERGDFPPELQGALWIMDEYISDAFRMAEGERIQDRLFFKEGCRKIFNMSASASILGLRNQIELLEETEALNPTAAGAAQLVRLRQQLSGLEEGMNREFARSIQIKQLGSNDPVAAFNEIARGLAHHSPVEREHQSYLIEVPSMTVGRAGDSRLDQLCERMKENFPSQDVALLYRKGPSLYARVQNHGQWEEKPYAAFDQQYRNIAVEDRPVVCCFYGDDTIGGDFEAYSHEAYVISTEIVYLQEEIPTTHTLFQQMRRMRRGEESGLEAHVNVWISPTFARRLGGNPTAEALLALASQENARLERLDEVKQMEAQLVSRKVALLEKSVKRDLNELERGVERIADSLYPAEAAKLKNAFVDAQVLEIRKKVYEALKSAKSQVRTDSDINTLRQTVLGVVRELQPLSLTSFSKERELEWEVIAFLKSESGGAGMSKQMLTAMWDVQCRAFQALPKGQQPKSVTIGSMLAGYLSAKLGKNISEKMAREVCGPFLQHAAQLGASVPASKMTSAQLLPQLLNTTFGVQKQGAFAQLSQKMEEEKQQKELFATTSTSILEMLQSYIIPPIAVEEFALSGISFYERKLRE